MIYAYEYISIFWSLGIRKKLWVFASNTLLSWIMSGCIDLRRQWWTKWSWTVEFSEFRSQMFAILSTQINEFYSWKLGVWRVYNISRMMAWLECFRNWLTDGYIYFYRASLWQYADCNACVIFSFYVAWCGHKDYQLCLSASRILNQCFRSRLLMAKLGTSEEFATIKNTALSKCQKVCFLRVFRKRWSIVHDAMKATAT